jgi:NitT/TauT family transport system permease protein
MKRPVWWAIAGVLAFGIAWELWVQAAGVRPAITIEPSRIIRELAENPGFWIEQSWKTGWHTLVGVTIGLVAAVGVGAVLAAVRPLEWAAQPVLVLVMVTPWVAYITSVVNWVGTGTPAIVFMVAFVTFPPLVFAAVQGLRSADVAARELLASVDAGRAEAFWRLSMPSALPSLFTGVRFATGLGLAAAYFSESGASAADVGLGEAGRRATAGNANYPILWGSIVCAAILGVAFLVTVVAAERRLLAWHASQRTTAR